MSTIEEDVRDWFEYQERCESGGQGYPPKSNYEPGVQTSAKSDPTANATIPKDLVLIDNIMQEISRNKSLKIYKDVIEIKIATGIDDEERSRMLFVSIAKYYTLCRETMAYLKGRYDQHYSDRRKSKYPVGISN